MKFKVRQRLGNGGAEMDISARSNKPSVCEVSKRSSGAATRLLFGAGCKAILDIYSATLYVNCHLTIDKRLRGNKIA